MSNLVIATGLQLSPAALLFEEGFEVPDVTGYEEGTKPSNWLLAGVGSGFGYQRIGLNAGDESGDWVTTPTDKQGMDPNYTNSGACTNEGVIGPININTVTYRLTATVAYDKATTTGKSNGGTQPGPNYHVDLSAVPIGYDRAGGFGGGGEDLDDPKYSLIQLQSSVTDDDQIHEFVGEYTTDPVTDIGRNGYDLVVAIMGSTSGAIITSVKVEQINGAQRVNWAPDLIAPAAWYDAADPSTITESGGSVSQWDDKSGNNKHATQPTTAHQPITNDLTIGGLNVLRGVENGNDRALMIIGGVPTARSIFAVFQCDINTGIASELINLGGNDQVSPTYEFFVRYASSQISFDGTGSGTGKYSLNGGADSGFAAGHTDANIASGANIIEGVFDADVTVNTILGRNSASVGVPPEFKLGEIIMFPIELSTDDKQKVEGYLAWKWGLEANLPGGHPYELAPPTV